MKNSAKTGVWIMAFMLTACASFSPSINEKFPDETEKKDPADKVDVLFVIKHYEQTKGLDAVPKLKRPPRNFDDLLNNALQEIGNIDNYNIITVFERDINNIDKRKQIERLKRESNYTVELNILQEKSFAKYFFGIIASSITATIVPIRYRRVYTFNTQVYNQQQQLVKSYERKGDINRWVQTLMVFLYPFNHDKRIKEELYVTCLHNLFGQIETERVLSYQAAGGTHRTIYAIEDVCKIIEQNKPEEAMSWQHAHLNQLSEDPGIAIVVHFPDDGLSNKLSIQIFKMELAQLDSVTNNQGIFFWVNNEAQSPMLLISTRNESILKSHMANNHYLNVLLRGMFHLPK